MILIKNTETKKQFLKNFEVLCCGSKNKYEVWQDMIVLFALSIANSVGNLLKQQNPFDDIWQEREERYLKMIRKYTKQEQGLFPKMFAMLVQLYEENSFCDILGELFMSSGIYNKNKGQFFTPYDLCLMMAKIALDRKALSKTVKEKGYASIYDCACGAGATLIASVDICQNKLFKKHNWQNHIYCVAQDIEEVVALMCYIQLSLLGIPGYVCVGDTLMESTVKDYNRIYFTPLWLSNVWTQRRFFHGKNLLMH